MFLQYYEDLCRFAITFLNDGNEAEDVVQKYFMWIWENRKKTILPDNEKAFLFKSVYNACLNHLRNKNTRDRNHLNYFLELKLDKNESAITHTPEIQIHINKAIEKLPDKCRQIFILNKIEGLTQTEIANYLDISPKTVENQVANAIAKLRVELKPILHLLPSCFFFFLNNF
jgi:RNA polymerase sigma-70 factor (ECF subfamily)